MLSAGTTLPELSLADARAVAESIIAVDGWHTDREAHCRCPGEASHSTRSLPTDCKVVCAPLESGAGVVAPGIYCWHESCQNLCQDVSQRLRSALGKRCPSPTSRLPARPLAARIPDPVFEPEKLERIARRLDGIDEAWFAERSRKAVDNRTPASFLHELYRPGENVVVFDVFESQGQALWAHSPAPFDACELDEFRRRKPNGVWFLNQPVTGEYAPKESGEGCTRRSWQTVTAWRYLVLESDKADPALWLAMLAQLPLPIAAIYLSGGKSIHALILLEAGSKAEWDSKAARIKPRLITLGGDRKAMSAVRLTRLPMCERLGSTDKDGVYVAFSEPRMQRLIYLNGRPTETPICEMPL